MQKGLFFFFGLFVIRYLLSFPSQSEENRKTGLPPHLASRSQCGLGAGRPMRRGWLVGAGGPLWTPPEGAASFPPPFYHQTLVESHNCISMPPSEVLPAPYLMCSHKTLPGCPQHPHHHRRTHLCLRFDLLAPSFANAQAASWLGSNCEVSLPCPKTGPRTRGHSSATCPLQTPQPQPLALVGLLLSSALS